MAEDSAPLGGHGPILRHSLLEVLGKKLAVGVPYGGPTIFVLHLRHRRLPEHHVEYLPVAILSQEKD